MNRFPFVRLWLVATFARVRLARVRTMGKDWDERNARRIHLLDKELMCDLSEAEFHELAELRADMSHELNLTYPLPTMPSR